MIFELAKDLRDATEAMPKGHAKYGLIEDISTICAGCSSIVSQDPAQIIGQICGRLPEGEPFGSVDALWRWQDVKVVPTLLPIRGSLAAPFGTRKVSGLELDRILALECSPDGQYVAAGGWGKQIAVWEVHTGQVRLLCGHLGWIHALAFSPDGEFLASGSESEGITVTDGRPSPGAIKIPMPVEIPVNRRLLLWHVPSATLERAFDYSGPDMRGLAITADAAFLLAADARAGIGLWRLHDGTYVGGTGPDLSCRALRAAPKAEFVLAVWGTDRCIVMDLARGEVRQELTLSNAVLHSEDVLSLTDAEHVLLDSADVLLLDGFTSPSAPDVVVYAGDRVAVTAWRSGVDLGGRMVLSSAVQLEQDTIRVSAHNLRTRTTTVIESHPGAPISIASPAGSGAVVLGHWDGSLEYRTTASAETTGRDRSIDEPINLDIDDVYVMALGDYVLACGGPHPVAVYDPLSRRPKKEFGFDASGGGIHRVVVDHREQLFVVDSEGVLHAINLPTLEARAVMSRLPLPTKGMQATTDGRYLLIHDDRGVHVVRPGTSDPPRCLSESSDCEILMLAQDANGEALAMVAGPLSVIVYNLDRKRAMLRGICNDVDRLAGACFTRDGRNVLMRSHFGWFADPQYEVRTQDGGMTYLMATEVRHRLTYSVVVWSVHEDWSRPWEQWRLSTLGDLQTKGGYFCTFMDRIAVEDGDVVRVISLSDGTETMNLPTRADHMAFSPDGRYLAVCAGPRVTVWHVASGNRVAAFQADERLLRCRFSFAGDFIVTQDVARQLHVLRARLPVCPSA